MDKELKSLLRQGYDVINDLNDASDVSTKKRLLQKNGLLAQSKAKDLTTNLHRMVDAFDQLLNKFVLGVVKDRSEVLSNHSNEIIENVEYITELCINAEKLICDQPGQSNSLVEVKAQFLQILKECDDLKYVDYDTFTSVDLEVDLQQLFQTPLVSIVSKNSKHLEKHTLHALGFGDLVTHSADSAYSPNSKSNKIDSHARPQADVFPVCKQSSNIVETNTNIECEDDSGLDKSCASVADEAKPSVSNKSVESNNHSQVAGVRPCYMDSIPSHQAKQERPSRADQPSRADSTDWRKDKITEDKDKNDTVIMRKPTDLTASKVKATTKVASRSESLDWRDKKKTVASNQNYALSSASIFKADPHPKRFSKPIVNKDKTSEVWDESCTRQKNSSTSSKPQIEANRNNSSKKYSSPMDAIHSLFPAVVNVDEGLDLPPFLSPKKSLENNSVKKEMKKEEIQKSPELTDSYFALPSVMTSTSDGLKVIKGTLIKTLTGPKHDRLNFPTGMTVRPDGLLVVADTGNHVVKVMRDNEVIYTIGAEQGVKFKRPSAVVCDKQSNIYVKDDYGVQAFDIDGKRTKSFGSFQRPFGLGISKNGSKVELVTIDEGRGQPKVFCYSIKEDKLASFPYCPLEEFGTANSKVRFLATYENTLLASDLGSSMMYLSTVNGHSIKQFGHYGSSIGEFREPSGVTVDAQGNWMVGDSKNNRIQVFTPEGFFLAMMQLDVSVRRPSGIHLTNDGHLYVINYLDKLIQVFKLHK